MDASAYLRKQGWRGEGNSLDHTDRGIKKPLLVSKKVDVLGVGLNKHAAVSDQWWLRAFDEGLKRLGTGQETTLGQVQKVGVNRGGLYGRFVQGERIEGTIGLPTPEDSEGTSTCTYKEARQESEAKMAIDVPPEDKLERVVGSHSDQNAHDAMMHLLQNPNDAPAGMKKMLDRKRKRAERPVEKRARRKTERQVKNREAAQESREQAMEEGTWDAEREEEFRRLKEINRRASEFVLEAQRRGIIPAGPNEIRRGLVPTGANAMAMIGQPTDEMQQVFNQAGLNTQVKFKGSGKNSLKAQKYAREKMKRELKRAAKAYLMGEKPPQEMTLDDKKAKKTKKKLETMAKKARAAQNDAERMAMREERAAKKREGRARRQAEKEEITRIIAEREAAQKAGKTMDEYYAERAERELATANSESTGNEFDAGVDEVKFNMNSKGGTKKIPGVGVVDRYPTKAEKKAKKLKAMAIKEGISDAEVQARIEAERAQKEAVERAKIDRYRAMKHGMSLEEYREALAKGEVHPPKLEKKDIPPEKLAEYQKRAEDKGIKLEEYVKRREEKYAAKQAEKLGNPFQQDILEAAQSGAEYIGATPEHEQRSVSDSMGGPVMGVGAPPPNEVGSFVVDTIGDASLANQLTNPSLANQPTAFSKQAIVAISDGQPLAIVDTQGNETFKWQPNMPVPMNPRIWQGQKVKDLPKAVRKARKEWMRVKREEKKSDAIQGVKKAPQKKAKGARKVEAREAFVKQVLFESRKAIRTGQGSGMVTIEGIANVPLVKLETREGMFRKGEVSLARTVARRVLRNVRRAQKAEKGKGKGWKKRERSAKEAARNAGISGFTDKARLEVRGQGNRDLLL